MKVFFDYNWQKRKEWLDWCTEISIEELLEERTGGVKGILKTLFHIVDVEQRWISRLKGTELVRYSFDDFSSQQSVKEFSEREMKRTSEFLEQLKTEDHNKLVTYTSPDGATVPCQIEEILHHVIAHEIHHSGQLSIWARELNRVPISANVIGRRLFID